MISLNEVLTLAKSYVFDRGNYQQTRFEIDSERALSAVRSNPNWKTISEARLYAEDMYIAETTMKGLAEEIAKYEKSYAWSSRAALEWRHDFLRMDDTRNQNFYKTFDMFKKYEKMANSDQERLKWSRFLMYFALDGGLDGLVSAQEKVQLVGSHR
tara:strand:- start:197 stop:664 length:468 start_codon:yes stop_codon:yes gene_type:complete